GARPGARRGPYAPCAGPPPSARGARGPRAAGGGGAGGSPSRSRSIGRARRSASSRAEPIGGRLGGGRSDRLGQVDERVVERVEGPVRRHREGKGLAGRLLVDGDARAAVVGMPVEGDLEPSAPAAGQPPA